VEEIGSEAFECTRQRLVCAQFVRVRVGVANFNTTIDNVCSGQLLDVPATTTGYRCIASRIRGREYQRYTGG